MNQTKNNSLRLVNLIFFVLMIIVVIIISFSQLFVDKNYQPIRIRKLANLSFLKQVIELNSIKNNPECFRDLKYIIYQEDKVIKINNLNSRESKLLLSLEEKKVIPPLFINREKGLIAFLTQDGAFFYINLFNINNDQFFNISLGENLEDAGIINFDKSGKIYFYYQEIKDNKWAIGVIDEKVKNILVQNINYPGLKLTRSADLIENSIIYPHCERNCQLIIYSLTDGSSKEIRIATEDNSSEVSGLELLFFDEKTGKIIYQLKDRKTAYVTDFNGYLWHHIYLEPYAGNNLKINGILTNKLSRKNLIATSETKKQAFIYDINYIGLKLIELGDKFEVVDNQFGISNGCLLLKDKESSKFFLKDIESLEEQELLEGNQTLLQLF